MSAWVSEAVMLNNVNIGRIGTNLGKIILKQIHY
jgi:hypothetical protein